MAKELNVKLKQRYDTASNWTTNNPVLLAGELGIESDTKKMKVGDGTTEWIGLDYMVAEPDNVVNSINGKTGEVQLTAEDVGALPSSTPLFSGDYNDLSNKPTIPTNYIKDASVTNDVLTLKNQDDEEVRFEGGGGTKIIWRKW